MSPFKPLHGVLVSYCTPCHGNIPGICRRVWCRREGYTYFPPFDRFYKKKNLTTVQWPRDDGAGVYPYLLHHTIAETPGIRRGYKTSRRTTVQRYTGVGGVIRRGYQGVILRGFRPAPRPRRRHRTAPRHRPTPPTIPRQWPETARHAVPRPSRYYPTRRVDRPVYAVLSPRVLQLSHFPKGHKKARTMAGLGWVRG